MLCKFQKGKGKRRDRFGGFLLEIVTEMIRFISLVSCVSTIYIYIFIEMSITLPRISIRGAFDQGGASVLSGPKLYIHPNQLDFGFHPLRDFGLGRTE